STRAFGTRSHRDGYKDRVVCFACNFRGDEADLRRHFEPGEGWPKRKEWLDKMRAEFEGMTPQPTPPPHSTPKGSAAPNGTGNTGGPGVRHSPPGRPGIKRRGLVKEWNDLEEWQRDFLAENVDFFVELADR